uniref:Uncharacterized protein n=1 Tax=Polytomella parva TaxID=51329 RepID=A0A7S0YFF3_9CHLO|mmetsp:Transcript_24000/g.42850  ORF Transcript_24000/g.42850 Transcript_24000/m.42850 type:complete len:547 (+) Transcript_24000:676-2316(+)|eukprot:CAMPEP_0175080418 /NCGR_PEP_ID=MMETSP0052_2-20121109/25491_1 /TAXON_ID=51329 ORGANISM="Polytomella parva, Strain SAG 63-3" /NCGR_SAMPLE_ID=MMETSP0052_2 /ASSEMBLY_ACC=CAM_ASM_000194 /LENGTH=546 /DNA_ID=CAMNT_0016351105 /DNA_START=348 /DNA_END=1988 /DNA_ORIENTATION=+
MRIGHIFILIVALFAAAVRAAPARVAGDCLDSRLFSNTSLYLYTSPSNPKYISSSNILSYQDHTVVEVATNFMVTYYSTYKVVKNFYGSNNTYVLYQCGSPMPNVTTLGLANNTKVFQIPLRGISASDTTLNGFLNLLGVQDRVYYASPYSVAACFDLLATGSCSRSSNSVNSSNIDAKFSFSETASDSTSIAFTATTDPGALNRAEYIKYLSVFFNLETTANSVFSTIRDTFNNISANVATTLNNTNATKPTMAWIYYQPGGSYGSYSWAEEVELYFTQYRMDYVSAAGGNFLNVTNVLAALPNRSDITYTSGKLGVIVFTNLSYTYPYLVQALSSVDILIDESVYPGVSGTNVTTGLIVSTMHLYNSTSSTPNTIANLKFLNASNPSILRLDGRVNPSGSLDTYETAIARPDLVLADFVRAIYPSFAVSIVGAASSSGSFVRSLDSNSVTLITASTCSPGVNSQCIIAAANATIAAICPPVYINCNEEVVYATTSSPCAPTTCSSNSSSLTPSANDAAAVKPASAILSLAASFFASLLFFRFFL